MMMEIFIKLYNKNGLNVIPCGGEMFCYRCGVTLYNDDENCETDRFGRSFCSEECKKFYYGGED